VTPFCAMLRRSGTMRSGRLWLGVESAGDIHGILDEARDCNATDVHIMAQSAILFRIDGELQPYSDEIVTASHARHLACGLLSESQVAALDEQLDIDFMCVDSDQQRYLVNVGWFNGATGAASGDRPSIARFDGTNGAYWRPATPDSPHVNHENCPAQNHEQAVVSWRVSSVVFGTAAGSREDLPESLIR
jgi:hypothetical protein